MSESLIVRLSSQQKVPCRWAVWSHLKNQVIIRGELAEQSSFTQLTEQANQRNVVVLIPTREVILTEVTVPKGAARQLERVIPFLVEEDLAQDAEALHWSVLSQQGDRAHVCGVDRVLLTSWLDEFHAHSIQVDKVLPDVLAVPPYAEGLRAVKDGEQWLVRKGDFQGISLEEAWFDLFAQSDWVQSEQSALPLCADHPLPDSMLNEPPSRQGWSVESAPPLLDRLAEQAAMSSMNILSGALQPASSWKTSWRIWRPAMIAAGLLLVLYGVYSWVYVSHLESQAAQYHAESERIVRVTLPERHNIPTVSYLKRLMTQEEQRLSGGAGDSVWLNMLEQVAAALPADGHTSLKALRYDQNRQEMQLQIQGRDFEQLEQVREQLATHFQVELGQSIRADNGVSGTLMLKAQ